MPSYRQPASLYGVSILVLCRCCELWLTLESHWASSTCTLCSYMWVTGMWRRWLCALPKFCSPQDNYINPCFEISLCWEAEEVFLFAWWSSGAKAHWLLRETSDPTERPSNCRGFTPDCGVACDAFSAAALLLYGELFRSPCKGLGLKSWFQKDFFCLSPHASSPH